MPRHHHDPDTDTDLDAAFLDIVDPDREHQDDDAGDHDRLSHYVSKEDIVRAATQGIAVFALCGKKWRPSKNPENYPVCPECKAEWEKLKEE
ncbi:hypothetical protein AHiyo8_01140 [Arthrobacter sp. Hiyo8]|nr:hypothetical protein AHiyo8_01140 [Arthrobacter sp. Hiyo8]